jgi:hypothetical protein
LTAFVFLSRLADLKRTILENSPHLKQFQLSGVQAGLTHTHTKRKVVVE